MRNKILAFLIGLSFSILVLELFLRFLNTQDQLIVPSKTNAPFVILCLGNSFTQGSGADTPEGTYPRQLEKKLNAIYPNKNIVVVNGGLVSLNTSELIKKLDFMIKKTEPQLIILQIGSANYTNKFGYASSKKTSPETAKLLYKIHDTLSFFKTYKFIFELIEQKRNKTTIAIKDQKSRVIKFMGLDFPFKEDIRQSVEYAAKAFRHNLSGQNPTKEEAIDPNMANTHLERLLKYLPDCPQEKKKEIHNAISQIYFVLLNDFDNAIEQAQSAFLANNSPTFYSDLSVLFFQMEKSPQITQAQKAKIDSFLKAQERTNPDAFASSIMLSESEIESWIEKDFEIIINRIKDHRIPLALMNYHPMINSDLKNLNDMIAKFASKNQLPLIDVNRKFKELWNKGEKLEEYHWIFLGRIDNHLNTKGYGVVADTIIEQLEKEKHLLPLSKSL